MLETMRNAAKTWVAKLLMAALVLSFGVWGIRDVSTDFIGNLFAWTGWGPKDLVHVAGRTIREPEYNVELQRTLQGISAQSGQRLTIDDARRMGIDKSVLDNVIAMASIEAQGEKMGLAISDKTISQSIADNKMFQDSSGKFDAAIFGRLLQQNNMTESEYVAIEKQNRLRTLVTGPADAGTKLPKTLNTALMQYRGESREAKYFTFTVTEADLPAPTDAEIKKQYEATPAAYTAPEYRSLAVMKVEPADIADRAKISPEELQAGYESHKADYFTPEKRTILQLSFPTLDAAKKAKDRISSGEDILKIATEIGAKESDITLADRQRGDFLDSKIGEAAFALAPGAVSDPVAGTLATVLLKAVTVTPEKQGTFDEVKAELTTRLQLEKAKEEITNIYNSVEDGRSQQMKFEDIASRAGIPFKLVSSVSATGQDATGKDVDITSRDDVLKAAFLSDVGNADDAIAVGDGYVWYEVREITPPTLKKLDVVKADVIKDLQAAKLRDLAGNKAKELLQQAKAGANIDALALKTNSVVKNATGIKRNETSQDFDGAAVVSLYSVGDQGFAWSLEGDGRTARIMQVSKITLPAVMASSPEATKLQDETKAGFARDMIDTFVATLRKNANVTINEELWKQNSGSQLEQP